MYIKHILCKYREPIKINHLHFNNEPFWLAYHLNKLSKFLVKTFKIQFKFPIPLGHICKLLMCNFEQKIWF
jgi:hypothetical protein